MATRRMVITLVVKGQPTEEKDLEQAYESSTWEGAAANQQMWLDQEGHAYYQDLIDGATEVKATVSWEEIAGGYVTIQQEDKPFDDHSELY